MDFRKIFFVLFLVLLSCAVFAGSYQFTVNGKQYTYNFDFQIGEQSYNCSSNEDVNICFELDSGLNADNDQTLNLGYSQKTINFGETLSLYPSVITGNVYNKMQWYWKVTPEFASLEIPYKNNTYSYESGNYFSYNPYHFLLSFKATYPGTYKANATILYGLDSTAVNAYVVVKKPTLIKNGISLDNILEIENFDLPLNVKVGNVDFNDNNYTVSFLYSFDNNTFTEIKTEKGIENKTYSLDLAYGNIKNALYYSTLYPGIYEKKDVYFILAVKNDTNQVLYSRSYNLVWSNPPPVITLKFPSVTMETVLGDIYVCNKGVKYDFDYTLNLVSDKDYNGVILNLLLSADELTQTSNKLKAIFDVVYSPANKAVLLGNPQGLSKMSFSQIADNLDIRPVDLNALIQTIKAKQLPVQNITSLYSAYVFSDNKKEDTILKEATLLDNYYTSKKNSNEEQFLSYFLIKELVLKKLDSNSGFFFGPLQKKLEYSNKGLFTTTSKDPEPKMLVTYLYYNGLFISNVNLMVFIENTPKIKSIKPVSTDWIDTGKKNYCNLNAQSKMGPAAGVPKKIERKNVMELQADINASYDYIYDWYLNEVIIKSGDNAAGQNILDSWDFKINGKLVDFNVYDLKLEVCYKNAIPDIQEYYCSYNSNKIEIVPAVGLGLFLDVKKFQTMKQDEIKELEIIITNNGLTEYSFTPVEFESGLWYDNNEIVGLSGPYTNKETKDFDDFTLSPGDAKIVYYLVDGTKLAKAMPEPYNISLSIQGLEDEFAFTVVGSTKVFKTPAISFPVVLLLLFAVGFIISRKVRK
ncbi:MAG: hypothetical protein PHH82_00170 [Candidatus ainarchaeum sp.]|nr:hypothetical protein [Candidatus ainarchaeum sp.]